MSARLADDIALRVGLTVRLLPGVDAASLLRLLIDILGEPITDTRLQKLRANRLRNSGDGVFAHVDADTFQKAIGILKGRGVRLEPEPVPSIACGVYCELSGSVRVACASNRGERIDAPFHNCARFLVYQVSPDYIRLIDIREPADAGFAVHDGAKSRAQGQNRNRGQRRAQSRVQSRAQLIRDCDVLYTAAIGAAAAATVVGAGLHPVRLVQPASAQDELARLQQVVAQASPPPWLVKAMGRAPRMRSFNEEVVS